MWFDVVIAGSGFSGSLLGWILARHGRSVLIVDRQHHPRLAIGEFDSDGRFSTGASGRSI